MADKLRLEFPFPAKPKARPRVVRGHAFMPKDYSDWKTKVRAHAMDEAGKVEMTGPLRCEITLYSDRFSVVLEKIDGDQQYVRSDIDNAAGGVMDALQPKKGGGPGIYDDDRQIRELSVVVARKGDK